MKICRYMEDQHMTIRENLIAALEGRKPERIPYTIYEDWIFGEDLECLMNQGLCIIPYVSVFRETIRDVEQIRSTERWNGQEADILTYRTSVGNIRQVSVRGWVQEFFLKTPQDYRVMTHVIRNTQMEADPKPFLDAEERIGENGLTLILGRRSPIQTIMVDFAGLEAFAFHMADEFPELDELFDALMEQLMQTYRHIASGPGRYVSLLENMTAEVWGPERLTKYHLPVYETILPILHQGGKKVYAHYDGKLACVADLVAKNGVGRH